MNRQRAARVSIKEWLDRAGLLRWLNRWGLRAPAEFVWRAVKRPETIRHELDLWGDYLQFRRRYEFLGAHPAAYDPGKTVLVISPEDFVAQAKEESMLAKALEVRGYRPVVLTTSWCRWARRYHRVFGFKDFLYLDRWLGTEVSAEARRVVDALVDAAPTLAGVRCFTYRDVDVGRQVLATLLRSLHQGTLDLRDPRMRERIRRLSIQAIQAVDAAERILDHVRPSVALVCDALYVGVGGVVESALNRGIPVVQWVASQRDDALTLKRLTCATKRAHPWSLSEATWEAVQRAPWTAEKEQQLLQDFAERYVDGKWTSYYNRAYGTVKEPEEVQQRLGLDRRKKTAVIFAHILWDATLFWGDDLFEDYEEWLVETVRAACQNPQVNWVVKLHPQNVWKLRRDHLGPEPLESQVLRQRIGTLPPHITLLPADTDISTFSLFAVTDYCLTVRGTIGIEMAAFGIPVFTAGTGRYAGWGFTIDSQTRKEYLDRLGRLHEEPSLTPSQVELAKKYAFALFILRPARFEAFRPTYRSLNEVGHPLDHDIEIRVGSGQDLRALKDLQAFAAWVVDSDRQDFLDLTPDFQTPGNPARGTEVEPVDAPLTEEAPAR